ncbi:MAG: orotidine 5'-phosphate decarboxylase [Caldilineaceae bacterium]|nr:orotidine 5'-phosphate decarboxylase [Caldilineaceae bacterium]
MASRPAVQLALDVGDPAALIQLARELAPFVDWVEAGTPLILAEGMKIVSALQTQLPSKPIVADVKIMDGGYHEANLAFAAGAAIVTVLGVTGDATIRGALKAAREHGGRVMADLLQVPDVAARAQSLTELGVDYLCVHTAYDLRETGASPVEQLALLSGLPVAPLVVAGGIGPHNLDIITAFHPAAIVVGGAITNASEPTAVAREIQQILARQQAG